MPTCSIVLNPKIWNKYYDQESFDSRLLLFLGHYFTYHSGFTIKNVVYFPIRINSSRTPSLHLSFREARKCLTSKPEIQTVTSFILGRVSVLNLFRHAQLVPNLVSALVDPVVVELDQWVCNNVPGTDADENSVSSAICLKSC